MIDRSYSTEGQSMESASPDISGRQRIPARRGVAAEAKRGHQRGGSACVAACRNGPHRRVLGMPPGHDSGQRHEICRCAFRDCLATIR